MKKLLTSVVLGAVAGVSFVQYFDRNLSSDLVFFRDAAEKSDQWAMELRKSDEPCYIISGSSDVRMGVDPEVMQKEGVRAINTSYNAGYGQNLLAVEALRQARPGDTVVYVPLSTKTAPDKQLTGSMKLGFQRHGLGVFEPGIIAYSAGNIFKIFAGDINIIGVYAAKKLYGAKSIYRYNERTCIVHDSGWVELLPSLLKLQVTAAKCLEDRPLPIRQQVSDLSVFEKKCKEKGIDFIVRISVGYGEDSYRALKAGIALHYVKQGYRVLKEADLGVETDRGLVGDTVNHLSPEGARKHSLNLAHAIKEGAFWTEGELIEEMRKRGWNEDGTPIQARPAEAAAGQAE